MLRKVLFALPGLALLASACGGQGIVVRAQEPPDAAFFTQVVDPEGNAGVGLSITSDADGNPHLAYLTFQEEPPAGEPAPPTDPLAPVLPAVQHAHLVGGIWTHSTVFQEAAVAPEDVTDIAVDAEGVHHVVWTQAGALLYSSNAEGEFSEPEEVAPAGATGISVWADERGTPYVAFYENLDDPEGPAALVRVATPSGQGWDVETAAESDFADPQSTAVGPGPDGPMVAYADPGGVRLTRRSGQRWVSETADPDGRGGVSMALDADGNPHLAYLTSDDAVRHAHSIGGSPWEISDVATGAANFPTSIALDPESVHFVAWQGPNGIAVASNASGEFVEEPLTGAETGTRPGLAAGPEAINLAWYDTEDTELHMATRTDDVPLLAMPSPSAAAGGGEVPAECQPEGTELTLTAPPGALSTGWAETCLAVEAEEPFSIELVNQDTAPHNVGIYSAEPPTGPNIFSSPISGVAAGATETYEVPPIDQTGNLYFQCDIHPTTMTGTFVVAGAEGGGGGGEDA
ncbi:MAG: cupredoxin domain-containing protein [Actinomycetota bacterium]